MDKIFCRKRIKIPKFIINKNNCAQNGMLNNKKKLNNRKKIKIILIVSIAIFFSWNIMKQIEPIINKQCIYKAKSIATKISNEQSGIVMANYKYEDLCTVSKDDYQNVKMIKLNIISVNEITSKIANKIQNELDKCGEEDVFIRMGSFTGSKILSGRGPKVKFRISSIGSVETNLKSEFKSEGINQTLHKIYLEVNCNVGILTPFSQVEENIKNQILIAEAVILGNVPSSYYNFEGIKENNLMEVIE